MRLILVEWLIELKHKFRLSIETLYQATYIVDLLLEMEEKVTISNFQLLGISALFIAAKY